MCRVRRRESTTGRSVRRPDRCSQCGTRWPRDRVTTVLRSICKHNHYHQINIYCFPTTIVAIPSIESGYFSFPIYAQDDMSLRGSEKIICYKGVYFNPAKHGQFGHLLFWRVRQSGLVLYGWHSGRWWQGCIRMWSDASLYCINGTTRKSFLHHSELGKTCETDLSMLMVCG